MAVGRFLGFDRYPVCRASDVTYDPAVGSALAVRSAHAEDAAHMARVNVRCWQETYRGLMPDTVLDDPGSRLLGSGSGQPL